MKLYQKRIYKITSYLRAALLTVGVSLSLSTLATPIDIAQVPLANSPLVDIKPNMLFVMDDSGSMGRDYMPDWANDNAAFFSDSSYNSIAYNPATVYYPPVNFTSAGKETASYPSQTGASGSEGGNWQTKPNWRQVRNNIYFSNNSSNLEAGGGPQFWVTIASEYCTKADLTACLVQAAPSATHSFPAPIRWCNNGANAAAAVPPAGACQATRIDSGPAANQFDFLRAPTVGGGSVPVATITFTSASSTPRVSSIRVGGQEILRRRTGSTNNLATLATRARDRINNCTNGAWGNCSVGGFSATSTGAVLTIYAPYPTAATPVVTFTNGSGNSTNTAFFTPPAPAGGRIQTTISSATTSYPYPGQSTKAAERIDCAGTTCTYAEEMTNYANWFAYYRTRAAMMKTATSQAFEDLGSDFRVGYMTTSTLGSRSLDIKVFNPANKATWYAKLFSTVSDRWTPLRGALSTAGRIYAGKTSAHGTFTDPVQYECQQNFTLLTTDGFWNTNDETNTYAGGPKGFNNVNVGNMDSAAAGTPAGMREGTPAVSNSLADVAKFYQDTDLRTNALGNCIGALGTNVCATTGTGSAIAPNQMQTMATLTLGLGVDGQLAYSTDYKTATSGDFADIKAGTKDWPQPVANELTTVDDLWHAAVNGGGTYFSAKKPTDLVERLKEAIASIKIKFGSGAAAAATTLNPVAGSDNFFYVTTYTTGSWTGNLEKRALNLITKTISPTAAVCVEDVVPTTNCIAPAAVEVDGAGYSCVTPGVTDPLACPTGTLVGTDCKVPVATSCSGVLKTQATRNILFNNGGALQPFDYGNLSGLQQTTFDPPFLLANLTQGPSYTPAQQSNLTGDKLVDYLKGAPTFDERATDPNNRLFRKRQALLGDLVNTEPVFVGPPVFKYSDSGYVGFKAAQSARTDVVYVSGNDGMLHAFNSDTLEELWAFIPSMVIPNMWKLADSNYAGKHSFYVNGDITVGDICVAANCNTASSSDWRTVLIGSLAGGGRGYYALDITNPASPQVLWEFDASATGGDVNLGYSFGKPVLTKRPDNTWVVLLTSGYNNIPDDDAFYGLSSTNFKPNNPALYTGGDGVGRLFVVNAGTGVKLNAISTSVGSTTTPSGLAQLAALTPTRTVNNITTFVYGGDLLGNVWRFDLSANTVTNFAQLIGPAGPQPVTVRPNLGAINSSKRIVLVGTGKYLELSDLTNTDQQTLYGITDTNLPVGVLVDPRAGGALVQQVLTQTGQTRYMSESAVDLSIKRGWYVDFLDSGERQDVNATLTGTNLTTPSSVTTASACQPDGYSWSYEFNYKTGGAVIPGAPVGTIYDSRINGNAVLAIGGKQYNFPSTAKGQADGTELLQDPSGSGFQLQRSIWREIVE